MAERFAQVNNEEIKSLFQKKIAKNTKRITEYGMKTFNGNTQRSQCIKKTNEKRQTYSQCVNKERKVLLGKWKSIQIFKYFYILDWFTSWNMSGGLYITNMSETEPNSCLKRVCTSGGQINGSYYKNNNENNFCGHRQVPTMSI